MAIGCAPPRHVFSTPRAPRSLQTMAEPMAQQLAAAHTQIVHLSAALEERDHTISRLLRENQELSETVVALQAQTLREQEAALNQAVRVPRRREAAATTSSRAHLPPRSAGAP